MPSLSKPTFESRRLTTSDYKFGIGNESKVRPRLERYFKRPIRKTLDRYCQYDFEGDGIRIELKSRNISVHSEYTTFMPVHKILSKGNGRLYFAFDFTDGLYLIEYTEEKFCRFEVVNIKHYDKVTPTFKIPVRLLRRIIL